MKSNIDKPIENILKSMRQIRDEISNEIRDMSFAEERDFLDKILKGKKTDRTSLGSAEERRLSAK